MWRMLFAYVLLLLSFQSIHAHVQSQVQCGSELVNSRGIIQTPGFPREFPVPLRCHWIINASHFNPDNVTIIVYLTQLYVTTGLTFTEYADVSFDMGSRLIHSVTEKNATVTSWVLTPMQYLKIDFALDRLEGNHLRVLDDLIDVYGFNITYEIRGKDEPERADACTATACSFAGNCLANQDYTQYGCSCFKGFSGRNCGQGPLCQSDRALCQNGGVCRVLGSGGHVCICPEGVTGLRCEHAQPDPQELECGDGGCVSQCPFVLARDSVCNCPRGPRVPTDRARYEGTVRLANLTALRDSISSSGQPSWSLENTLHKQIGRFLRSFNLSRMEELRVLNITPGAEVTFHFFSGKKDGGKVRDALNRLVERGRIGNLSLVTTHLAFKQEPTLLLQRVRVNQDEAVILEDDEFILSCIAQGSSYMTFQWYKDGVYINETKAMRSMWSELEPMNSQDQYTAILGISHASKLDEGLYTCQVVDWGMQQCKSLRLEVWTRPVVAVSPMSVTLERGGNVHIKCMSSKDGRHEKLGYNWTKNKALFKMAPGKEVWEDLSPSGSILKIYNAQKSAVYTCLVHGRLATKSVDVQVEVVNSSVIALCPDDLSLGIHWPETAPSLRAIERCPPGYLGHATRSCTLQDTHLAVWHRPDFSACLSNSLQDIVNNFVRLTLGYQNTSGPETLAECLRYLSTPRRLYPGEGESTVMLMNEVQTFMNHSRNKEDFANATKTFYQIVNILLEHDASLMHQERVVELQELVKSEAAIWGSMLSNRNSDHLAYSGLVLDVALLESSLNYKLHFPLRLISYPIWYMEDTFIYIDGSRDAQFGNKTFNIAVVNYKNLSRFLPLRYMAKLSDGIEVEYEINSRVVSIELSRETYRISPQRGSFAVEIEFEQIVKNYSSNIWNTTCGFTIDASFAPTWDFDSCYARTKEDSPNVTICNCNKPGTYAMLLVARTNPIIVGENHQYHMIVIIGCACCLVQTTLTLLLLFPYWWHHRSCLIFLKMQCCTATSGAMGIFIYAVRDTVPKTSLPYVTTSLEAFLLIGMSSHLSKLLIVYTEVVQIPRTRHLKQTVICLITIVPVIAVLFNHLAHDSTGWQITSWWLLCGTMLFYIFIAAAVVMLVMFVFLYCSVMRKLKLLSGKHADGNKAIVRRVGLLRRAGAIYCVMVFMVASSILYINVSEPFSHYIFSFASALLGFTIFLLYILRSETPLHYQVLKKLKLDNTPETEVSSESTDSPLRYIPKFGVPISNATVPVGREATLSCVVEDLATYKVAWLRVDTQTILTIATHVITKNHRIAVTHSDHRTWYLTIKDVRESDRGWYMCQINTDPMKSQTGFLEIVVPPDILDYPTSTDMVVREGTNVTLRCAATGSPAPSITWRREGGEAIPMGSNQESVPSVEGAVFNITRVNRLHMGAYLCIASNGVPPTVSKRIMLIVHFPPMIWIQNQLVGAQEGQQMSLECHSEAYPKSINYWTREKGEIIAQGGKYEPVLLDNAYKVHMKLKIKTVGPTDFGSYKCVSKNSLGDTDGSIKLYPIPHSSTQYRTLASTEPTNVIETDRTHRTRQKEREPDKDQELNEIDDLPDPEKGPKERDSKLRGRPRGNELDLPAADESTSSSATATTTLLATILVLACHTTRVVNQLNSVLKV